ncbi:MAG: type I DNA topoisomerase [Patescibacteria group bacterium]
MAKNLVIVESPAKSKTIEKILGRDYKVLASFGHVRDLPKTKLGVDVDHGFEPEYLIPAKAKKTITTLKAEVEKADTVYLATDLDREGEAISWHLREALSAHVKGKKKDAATAPNAKKFKRITFNQITEKAVKDAVANPRDLDMNLVNAQQARRVLDRLVGYKLSPLLWKKIRKGLSAGRVQSVAVRLVCEREEEIRKFKTDEYWEIEATLTPQKKNTLFTAKVLKKEDKTLEIKSKEEADAILADLEKASYSVSEVRKKEKRRYPAPPFTTSTLQQEAARKLGYSAKRTMAVAQQLYEGADIGEKGRTGLITYMRTDSLNLAPEAVASMRGMIEKEFGAQYVPEKPNTYKTKSKGAQEAHEAIRPTHPEITPEEAEKYLDPSQLKLYAIIWKRALASQMTEAVMDTTSVDIAANKYLLRATGSIIKFDGFIRVYTEGIDEGTKTDDEDTEGILPPLEKGDDLDKKDITPFQKFTQPPPRFTEASLVKELEKNEIGRPSTYAPTMSTIQDRGYVILQEKKFHPTEIGEIVNNLLVKHFPDIVDIGFTAGMEDSLDEVAEGTKDWHALLKSFWEPFISQITLKEHELVKDDIMPKEVTDVPCPKCGKMLEIKLGRFGKFMACTGFPDCKHTQPMVGTPEEEAMVSEAKAEPCEKCGGEMVVKQGRFGAFLACSNYPTCKNIKSLDVKKIDMKCPKCSEGDVVTKRTKRGKTFWGCNTYPKCDWASWEDPTKTQNT